VDDARSTSRHARTGLWAGGEHRVGGRRVRRGEPDRLRELQGGRHRSDQGGRLDAEGTGVTVNAICPIAYTPMSRATLARSTDADPDTLDVRRVTPVVLYLAHEDCELNGEVLSAGMGLWARIFTAKTRGFETASTEIDDVATHLDAVLDTADFPIPRSSRDQFGSKDTTND
jgi:hypothetical protein